MLPGGLPALTAARARAWLADRWVPPAPRDSATVALLRDAPGSTVEVYLLRRVPAMAFAAGMHVFPGGAVDPRDGDADIPWAGPPPAAWSGRLSADVALTRALACAAVRETFEESGVLLAGPDSDSVVADTTGEDWEADRRALLAAEGAATAEGGGHTFSDLLRRRALLLRADLLRPWSHWVTPEFEQRRYDTRFFVAALPLGQRTREVGGEADSVAWLRPGEALRAAEEGRLPMLPPTAVTLGELARYDDVADVLAAADSREIRPLLARPVLRGDEVEMVL